jgi:murein DD-endopeptidase MepM/ murein hydrolase activator NlpD
MIDTIGVQQHVLRRRHSSSSAIRSHRPLDRIKQNPVPKQRSRRRKEAKEAAARHAFAFRQPSPGVSLFQKILGRDFSFQRVSKKKTTPAKDFTVRSEAAPDTGKTDSANSTTNHSHAGGFAGADTSKRPSGKGKTASFRSIETFFGKSLLGKRFLSGFLRLMNPAIIMALAGFAALILYCYFVQMRPEEEAFVSPREDTQFRLDMASYAGLSPQSSPASEDIPLDLMETFAWRNYTIRRGDTVSKIAANHAISLDAIIASNGIANAKRLYEGQVIRIPNMDGIPYTVRSGDTLLKISSGMGVPLAAILDANDIQSDTITPGTTLFIPGARMRSEDLKLALGELFIYPIRGRLTSPFGWRNDPISGVRRYHAALDLAANTGTPVKAAMEGKVATVGYNGTYGKFIILSHGNGFQTMYAHLSVTSVTQGSTVQQGTKIGEVGSTGYSTGPHLHFAVYKNGRAVNPFDLLSP